MNYGALIVVILGVFLAVIGLRGTQANVFPWFFSNSQSGPPKPDSQGNCPSGYVKYKGTCVQVVY